MAEPPPSQYKSQSPALHAGSKVQHSLVSDRNLVNRPESLHSYLAPIFLDQPLPKIETHWRCPNQPPERSQSSYPNTSYKFAQNANTWRKARK